MPKYYYPTAAEDWETWRENGSFGMKSVKC